MGVNSNELQQTKFLTFLTADIVAAGVTTSQFIDENSNALTLETIRAQFGNNLNTLIILNTGAVDFWFSLDGKRISKVNKANGSFSMDWKDGVNFNRLEITNADSVTSSAAGDLSITIGRTGA